MKELMKILGALFLSMTILFSCSEDAQSDKAKKEDTFKKEIKDPCDILDYSVKIFEDLNDLADNYDDIDDLEDDKKDKKKVDDYFDDLEDAWKYAFKEFDNEEMEEVFGGGCDNEDEMDESFDEVEYFFEERCQEWWDFISEKMINMQEESYDYEGKTEKDYYEDEAAEEVIEGDYIDDVVAVAEDNCFAIMLDNLNEDPRPEVFADMGIPSNEDIANCVCNQLSYMTDEELIEWIDNDDMDPINNEEDKEQIEVVIKCMGFDSFEDYMSKMMEMMQVEME